MAVGTDAITCYENEDLSIVFTTTPTTVTGFTFRFDVKQTASDPDPALATAAGSVTGAQQVTVTIDLNIAAGSYVYGLRRTDASSEHQYAQGELTVLASVNEDH